jgi:hypothetical protein
MQLTKLKEIVQEVKLEAPTGETLTMSDVVLKYMTEAEFDALVAEKGDDCLHDVILGWGKFLDAENKPIEFSTEVLTELISFRWAKDALLTNYARALMGAGSKNFGASLALGRLKQSAATQKPNQKKTTRKVSSRSSVSRKKRVKKS